MTPTKCWSHRTSLAVISFVVISVDISVVCGQTTHGSESQVMDDEVTLAALILAAVACTGVIFLSIVVACLLSRLRKEKRRLSGFLPMSDMEKAPAPYVTGVTQHVIHNTDKVPRQGSMNVGVGTLRQVTLSLLQDLLLNLYNVSVKMTDHSPPPAKTGPVRRDSEQQFVTTSGSDQVQKQLRSGLVKIFPRDGAKVDTFLALGQAIMTATTVRQLSDAAFRVMRVCVGVAREWGVVNEDYVGVLPTEGQGHVNAVVEDDLNSLVLTWDAHKFSAELLRTTALVCQALRDERRQPTPDEYLAIQVTYHLLSKGQQMSDSRHRPLGSPGFRPHAQTQLALTDPGYGHVMGTTRRSDWLQGVVVHVQHIGSLEADSDTVPSLFDLGKVRLHVGDGAPTTFFVSRHLTQTTDGSAISQEAWEADLGKVVQLTANSVSSAFYQGAAACHVSMSGLTTSQAVAFMSQLRPHVRRDRHLQALSAVWDLATPLTDDYDAVESEGEVFGVGPVIVNPALKTTKVIEEPYHIARRAIEITLVGGFDQVTWYSSCDDDTSCATFCTTEGTTTAAAASTPTSDSNSTDNNVTTGADANSSATCVIRQLSTYQVLSLVHQAHSQGLLTYFTGGVTCLDIRPAVLGGVDGVGVGGVGMLHHANTGRNPRDRHGPFMEENIPEVLSCRDEAADTLKGRGSHLLARLDTMFFEGSLASVENAMRTQLFNAIVDEDEAAMRSILSKFHDVLQLPNEFGHPLMGTARRLVTRKTPALKDVAESAYEWAMFVTRLRTMVERGDEAGVCEEYGGEPWHTYRRKYRQHRQGPQGYFRQVSFQVALKTDFSLE